MTTSHCARSNVAGQALVMMAGGLVAVIVMVGLILDGGNAWAHQRAVHNGSDAAAEAGAVILAERLAGATEPGIGWPTTIADAVNASATANGIAVTAYYTDICGIPLKSDGTAALTAGNSYDLASAQPVGATLPLTINSTPNCPSRVAGPVAGILAVGHQDLRTYLVNVVGINTWGVTTQATAAAGYLQESCAASTGDACAVLPVTVPTNIVTCDGSNNPILGGGWLTGGSNNPGPIYKVPLCGNSPGNVGWLDWTPPSGGSSELVCSILHPNNPAIVVPSWQYVTSTGNVNGGGGTCGMSVEDAIRTYDGQVVTIPLFDLTCNTRNNEPDPDSSNPTDPNAPINTSPNYGCPPGDLGGNGQNQWYRFPAYAHFQLCISSDPACTAVGASYGAYISGNNRAVCDTGNGATSCIVGRFVSVVGTGTIGAGVGGGTGNSKAVGVQLIK